MSEKPSNTATVVYQPPRNKYAKIPKTSITVIGIDTEADASGKCFMICTSLGDIWTPDQFPECMFDRKHRDQKYVAYNLKYDMGALIQHLPRDNLEQLRSTGRTEHEEYKYKVIANKMLSISKGHKYVTFYDMLNYYGGSLDFNAEKYLGEHKLEQETKSYTEEYIEEHWDNIAEYCIHDAELVQQLATRLIKQFNAWGLHVRKLYSTAHVSYSWFAAKCGHPSVNYFWRFHRTVLDYAMAAYSGGKFEVTQKGPGYYYEYDIVSAYPATIADLVDLSNCRVVWSNKYRKYAVYGFLHCIIEIPFSLPSPVAVKRGGINTFPVGRIEKIITKCEYEYLTENGASVEIKSACWIHVDKKRYLYRAEINRIYELKQKLKHAEDPLAYHTIKILMNSLYGKFVQLIEKNGVWHASASWNPIYAAHITAKTRVQITEMQRLYTAVIAVHTDSVISSSPLQFPKTASLGQFSHEIDGDGLVVGCGVYQIGEKSALRGVSSPIPLLTLARQGSDTLLLQNTQVRTWRQILNFGWDIERINRFETVGKELRPNADKKRLWLDDAESWPQLLERSITSLPLVYSPVFSFSS